MEKVAAQPTGAILLQRSHNAATAAMVNNLGGTWYRTDLERDYVSGPRGEYYYPESGGPYSLAQLRDAGSRSAWIAGLACATTRTDHAPDEGTVDIGFHYRLPDDPPVAIGPLEFSTCRNQDLELDLAPWAWSPSGCPLTWTLVPNAGPWHGTLLGTLPEVTYRPAPGYCGSDSFRFRASDGGQESEPATVNIYVGDAYPEAHCQDVMTGVNTPVAFTLSGTDACDDELTFRIETDPMHGQITGYDPETGEITYDPSPSFQGSDQFWFSAANCGFDSAPQWATMWVVPAPVLTATCGPDRILLRWAIPPWVEGLITEIQIKRKVAGVSYGVIATLSADARSYVDTAVSLGVTYCYVVVIRRQDSCTSVYYKVESNEVCLSTCSEPPCEEPVISGWLFTDEGFIAGGQNGAFRAYNDPSQVAASPWSFPSSTGSLKLRMDYEDDTTCASPPFNENIQIATAEAVIMVAPDCPARMTVDWDGMVEQQNTGYERMWLYVDGNQVDYAQSTEGVQGCAPMLPVSGSREVALQPGFHLLRIVTDTGTDGWYHTNAFYRFEISFQPE